MSSFYQSVYSISIQAPVERAYQVLADWEERMRWRRNMTLQWDGEAKAFVGQTVKARIDGFPLYFFQYRVTGLEPPYRIYMEYTAKPLTGRWAIEILPEEKGCQVSIHWMKVEPAGVLAKLFFVLGFGVRSHRLRSLETLRMLKEFLEKKPS